MQFISTDEIYSVFPGMKIVVVFVPEIVIANGDTSVDGYWREKWRQAASAAKSYQNAQSHPRIRPWRSHFTKMGFSGKKFPSSAEALLRRAMKSDEPFTVNPLVDFYNAISLHHIVPAGAFDWSALNGPLEARLTCDGDTFTSLDGPEPVPVPAGETAYACGNTILSRHLVWRQARVGLITTRTRSAILLAEVPDIGQDDLAQYVKEDMVEGLKAYFQAPAWGFIASAQSTSVVFD